MKWYTFKRRLALASSDASLDSPVEGERGDGDEGAPDGTDPEENEEEEDHEMPENLPTPPALKALYTPWGDGKNFLLAMGGWARGAIFECSWEVRNLSHKSCVYLTGRKHVNGVSFTLESLLPLEPQSNPPLTHAYANTGEHG